MLDGPQSRSASYHLIRSDEHPSKSPANAMGMEFGVKGVVLTRNRR
jgi:hypothetical protein